MRLASRARFPSWLEVHATSQRKPKIRVQSAESASVEIDLSESYCGRSPDTLVRRRCHATLRPFHRSIWRNLSPFSSLVTARTIVMIGPRNHDARKYLRGLRESM